VYVCLFDIDGTLLDTGGAGRAAMLAAFDTEFGIQEPTQEVSMAGRTDRAIIAELFAIYGFRDDEQTWQRFLDAYLEHLPRQLAQRDGLVLPGVRDLLESLALREDVLLGLLTGNYRQGALLKLEYYRLRHFFGFGGYGDRHHHRDDIAREALAELAGHHPHAIDPGRVWVIGDTPADVRCGRAIAANVIAVGTGAYDMEDLHAAGPDQLLPNLADRQSFLELLN